MLHDHFFLGPGADDLIAWCGWSWGESAAPPLLCVPADGRIFPRVLLWAGTVLRAVVAVYLDRQVHMDLSGGRGKGVGDCTSLNRPY